MSPCFEDEEEDVLSDNQSNASSSSDDEPFSPPPLSQNYFAPPFYGRPPTPLPPSPSLTSLLRPSRPTTPDPSDDDIQPVPRASPKVPTYEYYGFVVYLFSSLTFLIYLLWAYLPSPFLHALGIYYYPNRWWALAIPAFITMLIVYIYVALALYNTEVLTLPLTSIETIVDEAAKIATIDDKGCIRIRADGERKPITEETARSWTGRGYGTRAPMPSWTCRLLVSARFYTVIWLMKMRNGGVIVFMVIPLTCLERNGNSAGC